MSRPLVLALLALSSCLPELERDSTSASIRQALPNWTPSCDSCLQQSCSAEVQRCADDSSCAAFVACRWGAGENPSPASALECEARHGTSDEQPGSTVRELSNCWQNGCTGACELGTRWECAGSYALPPPEASGVITVQQVLQQLDREVPVSGASVRLCPSFTLPNQCDDNFAGEGVTDDSGIAAIDVTLSTDNRPGWSGYGRVRHPDGGILRLQSNLVLSRSRFALQHVPNALETLVLQEVFDGRLELGNVVFQVFDCAHTSAEGVLLEVTPDTPDAPFAEQGMRVGYLRGQGFGARLDPGGTRSEDDGGGAILNLTPDQWVWVSARLEATGQELARTRIHTAGGELLLLQLHPEPVPN